MDSFILLSIPLFVLVGVIMNAGGISERLLDLAVVLVGHLKAGIAHVNIVGSMIFSGMSGTTTSDVAGLGRIEIPMMIKEGFRPETAAVITAVSATIGPIIPPSVPFILYGALTGTSVGKLFLGGVIPGILLGLWLMAVIAWLAHRGVISSVRYTRGRASLRNMANAVRRAFWALLTPVILIGGMTSGYFTATEAAGIAVVYAIFIVRYLYRAITWRQLFKLFCESAEYVGVIMIVVAAASVFGWLVIQAGAADVFLDLIQSVNRGPMMTLIVLTLILLIMGMFVEATSMIILLSPILVPLIKQTGVDPVHFGVVFVLNMMIATITPPVGICGLIASQIAGISMPRFTREVIPYVFAMIVFLFVILFIAPLVTFLPNLVFE
jgi:tripartite ATP-independent transporter DctM subunit